MRPEELNQKIKNKENFILLDVREPQEYEIANLGGVLIPLNELSQRYTELDPNSEIIVMCHHGVRSSMAVQFLRGKGYEKTHNLSGGIEAWSVEIDSNVARY
mgnify:CR=1 FL=1